MLTCSYFVMKDVVLAIRGAKTGKSLVLNSFIHVCMHGFIQQICVSSYNVLVNVLDASKTMVNKTVYALRDSKGWQQSFTYAAGIY